MSQIADHVGRVVGGRYRLVSSAGTGSSAHVYRAEDSRLGRTVAVKMLHPALAGDPTFLKRFHAEAKAAAGLNHPHIVRVFDWGDGEAGPFLVLEFLGGGSLSAMIDAGVRMTPAQAARIGMEAAKALEYAHRRGLVHRDIKPANILFDEEGRTAIADFGLARALAEAAWTEPAGTLFGTARYTSPEQAQGHPAEGKSDVYSLGLSLYEAIVGETPFRGDSTMSLVAARVGAHIEAPEETGVLGVVIEGAMAPDARDRIDASRLGEELQIAARNLPAPAPLALSGATGTLSGGDPVNPADLTVIGQSGETKQRKARTAGRPGTESRTRRPRSKYGRVAIVTVAVIVLLAGAAAAAVETQVFATMRTVPALGGETVAQARLAISGRHLKLALAARRYIKSVPAGQIASQSPRAGAKLAQGSAVDVVVSKGPPYVAMPPGLVGMSEATAAAQLGARGLTPKIADVYSLTVAQGEVVSYSPATGLRWGDQVTLAVSEGPQPEAIPANLTGEGPATATNSLQALGLIVVTQQQNSSTVPAGQVIGTNPAEGKTANQGTTVTLIVSKGPVMVTVPGVSGDTVNTATAALQAAGLNPQNVYGPPNGKVFTTDPAAGTSVAQGTAVSIYTSAH